MRQIKFRGKRIDNVEWVCGYLIEDCYIVGKVIDWEEDYFNTEFWYKVDPETVGQYTGLKDKNGTEIYEGDIVKANMDFGPGGMAEQTTSIYWDENVGGWQFNYFDKSTIEIIGNIHDKICTYKESGCGSCEVSSEIRSCNPELLGGAK